MKSYNITTTTGFHSDKITNYTKWYKCDNCDYQNIFFIPKGQTVLQYLKLNNPTCENCKCNLYESRWGSRC